LLAAGTAIAQPNPQTLTGGVGVEERAQMMQRYDEYNLHLAFAQPDTASTSSNQNKSGAR